ncbi:DsbA family protein [Gemmatimonas sp.]|uniref:DsbA family protein n=1 Tax=Gemmatimonas sp. TaxID=1962908 RepID=UPI003982EF1D
MKYDVFDRVVSVVLVCVAVASLALIVQRKLDQSDQYGGVPKRSARRIESWSTKVNSVARPLDGETRAPVMLTVFTDFECPFCRQLDSLLSDYGEKNAGLFDLQIVHMPLSMHLNAKPAAHAFECGLQQGRAQKVSHSIYVHQKVLGQIPWDSIADVADVPSLAAFRICMLDTIPWQIEAGKMLAKELDLTVTPTVVVNDWLVTPSDPEYIFEAIRAVAAGKKPLK